MLRGLKSSTTGGYPSNDTPKRTLQQQGLEGMTRFQKSFEGLSDREAKTAEAVRKETDETKTDITNTLAE